MSFKPTNRQHSEVVAEFETLLNNFERILRESGSKLLIRTTKLGVYEQQLKALSSLSNQDVAGLSGIVTRYNQLNLLFSEDSGVQYKLSDLVKVLEGRSLIDDSDEEYNDIFFELSMAIRFSSALQSKIKLDMTTICDVIVDEKLAIECKYIHSLKGVRPNISKGLKQITQRVDAGLAEAGLVALDLSALLDKQKIWDFSQGVFDHFLFSNEVLHANGKLTEKDILPSITGDRNFSSILTSFVALQSETVFYSMFGRQEIEKMGDKCLAVIFQVNFSLCLEYKGGIVPLPMRSLNYFINPIFSSERQAEIKREIHQLASGV